MKKDNTILNEYEIQYEGETIIHRTWQENRHIIVERKKKNGKIIDIIYYEEGKINRLNGPASSYFHYKGDLLFVVEHYFIKGNYIGSDKDGFWALWDLLDDDGRSSQNMLNLLAKYS